MKMLKNALLPLALVLNAGCGGEPRETSHAEELASREDTLSFAFAQACQQPYSQTCNPMWTQAVTTQDDLLRVEYTASKLHCSKVSVDVYVDGVLKTTSAVLDAGQGSGWLDLGPVTPGSHTVGLVAHGYTGGCNTGHIESWGGTLSVTTTARTSFAQRCEQPYSQTCNPMWTHNVTTAGAGPLSVAYTTAVTHCSNVQVDVYVDGVLKTTTPVLSPTQATGWLHLGDVAAGPHTVGLVAHGFTGGCNVGYIESWGGTLALNGLGL